MIPYVEMETSRCSCETRSAPEVAIMLVHQDADCACDTAFILEFLRCRGENPERLFLPLEPHFAELVMAVWRLARQPFDLRYSCLFYLLECQITPSSSGRRVILAYSAKHRFSGSGGTAIK